MFDLSKITKGDLVQVNTFLYEQGILGCKKQIEHQNPEVESKFRTMRSIFNYHHSPSVQHPKGYRQDRVGGFPRMAQVTAPPCHVLNRSLLPF